MTQEEKAKRYDEALKAVVVAHKDEDKHLKATLERIFPELKESEEEKMIQYFKDLAPFDKADELYEKYGFSHKDAIAWLEKQGEQILANSAKTCKDKQKPNPCDGCTNRKGCVTCENGELRETMQKEHKHKFVVGNKIIYLNEEYEIVNITDHYILHTTKRTKIEVLHLAFDNEEFMELVEEPVSETTTKWPFIAGNDYICIKELYHFKKGKIYHCISNNYLIGEFGTVTPEHFNFDISDYFMKISDSKIKFKEGDSIRDISSNKIIKITAIDCDGYFAITDNSHEVFLPIVDQNNWELVEPEQELSHSEVTKISDQEEPVSEDLETSIIEYMNHVPENEPESSNTLYTYEQMQDIARHFAEWQKRQMMKDAVDGEVTHGKSLAIPSLGYFLDKNGLDFGDKVKLIIIKEG